LGGKGELGKRRSVALEQGGKKKKKSERHFVAYNLLDLKGGPKSKRIGYRKWAFV